MQQRDSTPGLRFPGLWSLFGGEVEAGEDLKAALERELVEELGCVPGTIEDELIRWEWTGIPPTLNHYFPVSCAVADDALELLEGQAMSWVSIAELRTLALTPDVCAILEEIIAFAGRLAEGRNSPQ